MNQILNVQLKVLKFIRVYQVQIILMSIETLILLFVLYKIIHTDMQIHNNRAYADLG